MKTFTTYAEKKAKQFFNLLQGYTKGIRITAILILLLMGVGNAWGLGYNNESHVYLDVNGTTKYYKVSSESWSTGCSLPGTWGGELKNQTFNDVQNLTIKGGAVGGWTNSGEKLSATLSYAVTTNTNTPSSWTNFGSVSSNHTNYNGNNAFYYTNDGSTDVTPTTPGTYYLHIKIAFNSTSKTSYAKFTIPEPPTYTVAGSKEVLGSNWDETDTNNDMTLSSGTIYTLTKQDVSLTKGANYECKVVQNHDWNNAWPNNNYSFSVQTTGHYDVTFTFNSSTKTVEVATTRLYALTYDGNGNTSGSVPTTTKYHKDGTNITVANNSGNLAKSGYTFEGWNDKTDGTGTSYAAGSTFVMPDADKTLYAKWTEKTYSVTISAGTGGTVSPSGSQTVGQVTAKTVTATPNANYEFVNWTSTGGVVIANASSATTTITATATGTLTANFRSTVTNSLTVAAGAGIASVTGSTDPVILGSTYPITATPETGYSFSTWTANPAANATFDSATTANTTVTVKNGSVTVTATATEDLHAITVQSSDDNHGTVTKSADKAGIATFITITAKPKEGYRFVNWTTATDGITIANATDASTTVTATAAGTITANFEEIPKETIYFVNKENWSKVNVHLWGGDEDNTTWPGIDATKADFQLHCCDVYYVSALPGSYKKCIFSNNGSNQTDNLDWTAGKYYYNGAWKTLDELTYKVKLAGSMLVNNGNWVLQDMTIDANSTNSITVSLEANTTYEFKIVVDGNWHGNTGTMTYGNSEDWTMSSSEDTNCKIKTAGAGNYIFTYDVCTAKLTVTYPTSYTVTYSRTPTAAADAPTTNPSVESGKYVAANTSVTFTAKDANNGYTWKGWYDNNAGTGTALSTNKAYTTKSINANTTIYAVYTVNTYNINIVANPTEAAESLTTSPRAVGAEKVNISTTAKFTYKFDNWTATDGITITDASTPSTSITATKAGTVTANFIQLQPTTVYLKPGDNWKQANARFAIHYWHEGQPTGWVDMTEIDCNRDYFVGTIPAGYTEFMFVRMNPANPENKWDANIDWNKTGNLTIPTDGKNLFTLPTSGDNQWNGATTNWSTYSTPSYEITLSPRIGGTITTDPASPVEVNTEVTVTMTPSTGYAFRSGSIKIGTNEAIDITQTSSTHTICGPTEITAEFVTNSEQVVYLKPTSKWKGDKPTFAVHVWNNGGDATAQDIPMTAIDCNGDYYTATIPAGFHSMVFYRKSTDGTTVWNKTADLDIPVNTTNNCYTITSTGSKEPFSAAEGSWTTYTPPTYDITINAPESGTISVTIDGSTTNVTTEAVTIENVALNAEMTVAFTGNTGYELGKAIIQVGNNAEANAAGTYQICGSTEITAYFVTAEDQVVYLRPNDNWLADDARFAAYAFNRYAGTEAAQWIELTTKDTDYTGVFSATIPEGFSHVQFVRMPETGDFSFDIDLAHTINFSIPVDNNNRFLIGDAIASGSDAGKYQGRWVANNTPIYGIPGDWQGNEHWSADAYPLMGPNGEVTVNITQTNTTLGFKVYRYPYATNNDDQWLGNSNTMIRGNSTDWSMTTGTNNCGLYVDIAGNYIFNFNIRNKKLTVQYPELPVPNAITVTSKRLYDNTELGWFDGEGTEADPHQLYIDEAVRLIVSPLTEVAGLTAYYKMGDNEEQTSNVFDWEETMSEPTKTTIQAYYKNATGTSTETVSVETPYYIQISLPFYLMTEPSGEININRVAAGENILVQFRSDAAATVGLYVKIGNGEEQKLTDITSTISTDYTHDVDNNIDPCVLHYIARSTATVHDRIFEATTDVAIYKNVIIKVNDPEGWVKNAYMWRDYSDAVLTQWPGDPVLQNFGTWRVFSVKYPYYDRFIVNDGKAEGATQTIDYVLPADDTCYELLDPADNGSDLPEDAGKYGLKVANCPGNLIVGDLQDTTICVSDQIVVIPSIALGLGYSTSNLTPSVTSSNTTAVTATMSGMNITIIGNAEGESTITVTYTLVTGETATKTFTVTVERDTHITIQVKVPVDLDPDRDDMEWVNENSIYIRYWGDGINHTNLNMTYLYNDGTYKYAQARIPLGTNGTNFFFYYETYDVEDQKWRQTNWAQNITTSGCYLLLKDGVYYERGLQRDGDNCADSYQVKILMANGKTYTSNTVSDNSETLSFFAPGMNETGYKAGAVMLYHNNKMIATIAPDMFNSSNVYVANLNANFDNITNVAPYTGDFYIRTWGTNGDIDNKGWHSVKDWNDTQKKSRTFTEFVSREGEFYNHYWVQAMNTGGYEGKDVSACVANDYNDDLAGILLQDKHTDEKGDIKVGTDKVINVRFGYDPRTNYFGRAILQGSQYDTYLNIHCDNAYRDKDCTPSKKFPYGTSTIDNKMYDISTWVYQRDFYVPITNTAPSATLYVEATSPNTTIDVTDHLLGYVINEITGEATSTPIQKTVIGSGTTNGTYLIRVIYDFKTNRIITAWLPQGTVEVNSEKTLNADVLFVRKENEEVPQIQLSSTGKIKSLESMFFAMELQRGDADRNNRHQEQYWFTLPFDCVVGSISGVPGYMQIWGIQRYNGKKRAENGWFNPSTTFWEWLTPDDVMHAGEGYLLVFDKKNAPFEEIEVDKMDAEGNIIDGQKEIISMMRLYFPSTESGFDMQQQSEAQLKRTYENHTCTITASNRYLQDSNWKVIGTTSYNNAGITGYTKDDNPNYEELSEAPSFRYKYEYTMSNDNTSFWYRYTPENGQTATYQSFFGYMVQFAGTINWQPIMSETVPEQIAARRYVPANERTSYTTRLELANAAGEVQDLTFVALDEKATTGFDQNKDLNKVKNRGTNIYTFVEGLPFAGNTLPMEKATVPVGVRVDAAGEYTFRMPDGTDGIAVTLVDNVTGTHTNMLMNEYTVTLNAGTIENRFYLVVDPDRTATSVENVGSGANGDEAKGVEKFLIDGKLFIRTTDGIFDAKGQRL